MTIAHLADAIGFIGVVMILIGYYLLNMSKVTALSLFYQLLNLFGSAMILVSLFFHWNFPAVVIEVAWIIVSLLGIYRILSRRNL